MSNKYKCSMDYVGTAEEDSVFADSPQDAAEKFVEAAEIDGGSTPYVGAGFGRVTVTVEGPDGEVARYIVGGEPVTAFSYYADLVE